MNPYTNPYAPPQNTELYGAPVQAQGDPGVVPDSIVDKLRGTRPWVLFLAIVGFLCTGLIVLGGLGMMAMGAVANRSSELLPLAGMGILYVLLGGLYVLPAVGLLRFATSISDLLREPRMERLGAALDNQRWFWKVVGIMTAVVLALYPIAIVVAVVAIAAKAVK
jgi:hypothetical protein